MGSRRSKLGLILLVVATFLAVAVPVALRFRPARLQEPKYVAPAPASQSPAARRLRASLKGANVIVIVTDAAAASHFNSFGYERNTTPNLSRLHRQSVLLTQAYAPAASTKPSIGSFFTSQFPDTHGALAAIAVLKTEATTLAQCFARAGYRTAAFSANPALASSLGYGRGFDDFVEVFRKVGLEPVTAKARKGRPPVDAALVLAAVREWLKTHGDKPFFLYVHFLEPHYPYAAPASFDPPFALPRSEKKRGTGYDLSLSYVDSIIGELLRDLDARGLLDRSVVVAMSDHGEAFGEHGASGHSATPYTEMTHVPLAFHMPSRSKVSPGSRSEVFCTTDLMPTLLDLFSLPPPRTMQGHSRLALLSGERDDGPEVAISRAVGYDRSGGVQAPDRVSYALRVPRYTLVIGDRGRRIELYDRYADPKEDRNIAEGYPQEVRKLRAQFETWADTQRGRPVVLPRGRVYSIESDATELDEATRRQLEALGYLRWRHVTQRDDDESR